MKILLLVLAIGIVTAWDDDGNREHSFPRRWQPAWRREPRGGVTYIIGNEFNYTFEQQILTGMPESSNVWSGQKIRSTIRLQAVEPHRHIMQVTDFKFFGKVNNRIDSDPRKILPDSVFDMNEEFVPSESSELLKNLKRPVSFREEGAGRIYEIQFEDRDSLTSKNLKRSLLQMFQINVDKDKINMEYEINKRTHPGSLVYTAIEDGVTGRCKNLYTVRPVPREKDELSKNVMNITKVRDFNSCEKVPVLNFTEFNPMRCENCSSAQNNLVKSSTSFNYRIEQPVVDHRDPKKDRLNFFLITDADMMSENVFQPFSENKGSAVTYIKSTLKLLSRIAYTNDRMRGRVQIKMEKPFSTDTTKKETLMMENPVLTAMFDETHENTPSDIPKKKQIVSELLDKIINTKLVPDSEEESGNTRNKPTDVSDLVLTLSRVLRSCNQEELHSIIEEYLGYGEENKKSKLVLDIMPTLCSRPPTSNKNPLPRLLEAIKNKEVSNSRAQTILTTLSLSSIPAPITRDEFQKLCKDKSLDSSVRRTSCLAMGHKIYQGCDHMNPEWSPFKTKICSPSIRIELAKSLRSLVGVADEEKYENKREEELLTAVKTIGNSGLREALPVLKRLMENRRRYSEQVRSQAVFAMRRMLKTKSGKTDNEMSQIAAPIALNQMEAPEVRIAAYSILIATKPSLSTMELLARTVDKDRSTQVAGLIYSHMQSVTKSSYPCCQDMKWKMSRALNLMPQSRTLPSSLMSSKGLHIGYFSKDLKLGGLIDGKLVYSPESPVPRTGSMRIKTHVLGNSISLVEFGFHAEGLNKVLEKTLGPNGNWYGRNPEESSPNSEPLLGKVRNPDDKIRGHVYYKMFGTELNFNTFDKETFSNIIRNQLLSKFISKKLSVDKTEINMEKILTTPKNMLVIPTECGLPLALNLSHVTVMRMKGTPEVLFPESNLKKIAMKLDLTPRINTLIRGSMTVFSHLGVVSGVKIDARMKAQIPVRLEAKLDTKSARIVELEMTTPDKERKLVEIEVVPKTLLSRRLDSKTVVDEKTINENAVCAPTEGVSDWNTKSLKMNFKVKYNVVSNKCKKNAPYHPFVGKQSVKIYSIPSSGTSKLSLSIDYDSKKTSVESSKVFSEVVNSGEVTDPESNESNEESSSSDESSNERRDWENVGDEIRDWNLDSELTSRERFWINKYGKVTPKKPVSSSYSHKTWMDWERNYEEPTSSDSEETPSSSSELKRKFEEDVEPRDKSWNIKKYFDWYKHQDHRVVSHRRVVNKDAQEHTILLTLKSKPDDSKIVEAKLKYLSNSVSPKMHLMVNHQPLYSAESSPNKIDVVFEMRTPIEPPNPNKRLPDEEQKLRSFLKIRWGKDLNKIISVRSTVEKSPEQLYSSEVPSMKEFSTCQRDRSESRPYSPACKKVVEKESELRQLTSVIETSNLPSWTKEQANSVMRMLQYSLYNYWSVEDVNVRNPSNKVLVKLRFSNEKNMFHLMVDTPKESNRMHYVPIPFKMTVPSYKIPWMTKLMNKYGNCASCEVTGDLVKTFDNIVLKSSEVKSSLCDLLIAKDCSKNGFYSVHLTKVSENNREAKITLNTSPTRIIRLRTEPMGTVKVVVDKKEVDVADGEEKRLTETDEESRREKSLTLSIKRVSPEKLVVKSPRVGLQVKYSKGGIKVSLSPMYMSKQCGICGDYNGEPGEELKTPSLRIAKTTEDFVRSYSQTNGKCSSSPKHETLRYNYNPYEISRHKSEDLSELARDPCDKPIRKHLVREMESRICFTQWPMAVCEPHCAHPISKQFRTTFRCLNKGSPQIYKYLRKISNLEKLKITGHTSEETMTISEDKQCFY